MVGVDWNCPWVTRVSRRSSVFQIKASEDASSADPNELFNDLKEKWDALENKSTVIVYRGGAVVAIWLSSIVVGAINSVPLLPKILELVGLGYTGWFVYRYLLFKAENEPILSSFLYASILSNDCLERALGFIIANRL